MNQSKTYEDLILPLAAIIESIGTKGKSPGTAAMGQRQAIIGGRQEEQDRLRQAREDENRRRLRALQEKKYGLDIRTGEAGLKGLQNKSAREQALRKRMKEFYTKLPEAGTPESKMELYQQYRGIPEIESMIKDYQTQQRESEAEQRKFEQQKELKKMELEYKKQIQDAKPPKVNTTMEKAKEKRGEDFITAVEEKKINIAKLNEAEQALENLPTGWIGKKVVSFRKYLGSDSPVMGDWQKVKMVLTDAQMMNTGKTKGAISDKEMALFASAAANDELISPQRVKVVLKKLKDIYEENEKIAASKYKRLYKIDPYQEFYGEQESPEEAQRYEFNSVQEAEAANLPAGTVIYIQGRKAVIE